MDGGAVIVFCGDKSIYLCQLGNSSNLACGCLVTKGNVVSNIALGTHDKLLKIRVKSYISPWIIITMVIFFRISRPTFESPYSVKISVFCEPIYIWLFVLMSLFSKTFQTSKLLTMKIWWMWKILLKLLFALKRISCVFKRHLI